MATVANNARRVTGAPTMVENYSIFCEAVKLMHNP